MRVFILWNEADYYGPDLVDIYETEAAARLEARSRHDAQCSCKGRHTAEAAAWPYMVEGRDVL